MERTSWTHSSIVQECLLRLKGKESFLNYLKKYTFDESGALKIPTNFSFITHPEEVLQSLYELVLLCSTDTIRGIQFDHSKCTKIDLGASAVLDVITIELRNGWKRRKVKYGLGGFYPKDETVKEIFIASGLPNSLNIGAKLKNEAKEKYVLFDLMSGGHEKVSATKSSNYELAAQELTDYYDACLCESGFSLTTNGARNLSIMIGEILTNAEEHSGHGKWFIIGYLRRESGRNEVNLAIFNFGSTIHETFLRDDVDSELKSDLQQLSNDHIKNGFFGPDWDEETLWTLYSLQEGVTRFRGTEKGVDRGNGTAKMIQFFQKLGGTSEEGYAPEMSLLSGSAHIRFDTKYQMKLEDYNGEKRGIIAFNNDNSLQSKPDKKCVKKLNGHFPGTVISMKFFIERKFLETYIGKRNECV